MNDIVPHEEVPDRPYSIRDENEDFSLISFLADSLQENLRNLPEEYLLMTEAELKKAAKPTACDYALRVSFWREFEKMMWKGTGKIQSKNVYAGICSDAYFYQKFIKSEAKFGWLIRPMQVYQKEMEAILARCTERLWELADIDIYVETRGKSKHAKTVRRVDPKLAEIVLKTVTQVENRVKGMAVQRTKTESRSMNVNVTSRSKANMSIDTMESLDKRIAQLQSEVGINESSSDTRKTEAGDSGIIQAEIVEEEREIIEVGTVRDTREDKPSF